MGFAQQMSALLSRRDKKILLTLLLFAIAISVIETASISFVMPFISVATNFSLLQSNKYFAWLYTLSSCSSPSSFVIVFGIILIIFYAFRSLLNIAFMYSLSRFSQGRFHVITLRFFQNYLKFHYRDFVAKNSETIRKMIIVDADYFTQIISAASIMLSEIFTVIAIYGMLFWVNWKMTCILTLLFCVKFVFLIKPFFERIAKQGKKTGACSLALHKMFSESFGNFKLIKFLSNERFILERFDRVSCGLARAKSLNVTFQSIPRFLLETLGFSVLVGVIIYVIYRYNDASFVMPIVSMYALAFYRFLPSVNKILTNYNQIIAAKNSMTLFEDDVFASVEELGNEPTSFSKTIRLQNLDFNYDEKHPLLRSINLTITKNQKIAIIGKSGCGKSTLVDLISGLYTPLGGQVFIDDMLLTKANMKAWRSKIGYIPQDVYLFDGTVAENVVFGRGYDKQKIVAVLQQANVYDYLVTQKGIDTEIGEKGVRLSGGQKQRIAIARALYLDPEVLILDEATSALDTETEKKIMEEMYVYNRKITLIIVTHRLSTISKCDKIYKIKNGMLSEVTNVEFSTLQRKESSIAQIQQF